MRRLVILGGGTAGTMAANKLRAAIPAEDVHIIVVDKDDEHHYQPGYLFLPFGTYTTKDIVRSRHRFLNDGIELVLTEIDRVDPDAHTVTLSDGRQLAYDILVIATGTSPRPDMTPGMDGPEYGRTIHQFYTLEGAQKLAEALRHFRGGRLVVHITEMPIKCPVAPLEFVFLADDWLKKKGIRQKTELVYVTPLDGAFTKPVASRELATALSSRGIEVETDFAIESVDGERKVIVSFDGREVPYDQLVTVPLNMGADYVARSGLGDDLNYVPCDQKTMRSLAHPDIYVLGDGGTLQTSKAGSVAHFSVEVFVENMVAEYRGTGVVHEFDGHANCFIESGNGKAMLLDFNYTTQPYTGQFPFPVVGPMSLLKETALNHWGKLAFKWIYWNMLLPGRPIPLPAAMSLLGKKVEDAATAPAPSPMPTAAVAAPATPAATAVAPAAPSTAAEPGQAQAHPIIPTF